MPGHSHLTPTKGAGRLRCLDADPCRAFRHRLRAWLAVAALIFLLSLLR